MNIFYLCVIIIVCLSYCGCNGRQRSTQLEDDIQAALQMREIFLEEKEDEHIDLHNHNHDKKGFNWGKSCDKGGEGTFKQFIPQKALVTVGEIPVGITHLKVNLSSSGDTDIQLRTSSNTLIVGWPKGILNQHNENCINFGGPAPNGMKVCYSGYNGVNNATGHEWIYISEALEPIVLLAYGYQSGIANVDYSYKKPVCCRSTAKGTFKQGIIKDASVEVGTVPIGLTNVRVDLKSEKDIDLVLVDIDSNVKVIAWKGGILNGHQRGVTTYKNIDVEYSGYNGVNNVTGMEYVKLTGTTTCNFKILAYGYQSGYAQVEYSTSLPSCAKKPRLTVDDSTFKNQVTSRYRKYCIKEGTVVVRQGGRLLLRDTNRVSTHVDSLKLYIDGSAVQSTPSKTHFYWKISSTTKYGYEIVIPNDIGIGTYELKTKLNGNLVLLTKMFIIFDAANPASSVYMSDPMKRASFLNVEVGQYWWGNALSAGLSGMASSSWSYHQFELLPLVMEILSANGIKKEKCTSAVMVSRYLSRVLNSAYVGDAGVMEGRWSGSYAAGRAPTYWTGSREILKTWLAQGKKCVKYAQCWVYANVYTTCARALGIPVRTVTNYRSAHDSKPYNAIIEEVYGESIWNFHVWNEVWLKRENIYVWNAVDATPQETSDDYYQMGPAPINKIQNQVFGTVPKGQYDVDFVAAEGNSVRWYDTKTAPNKSITLYTRGVDYIDTDIGLYVSTFNGLCTPDSTMHKCREDVTNHYKPIHKSFNFKQVEGEEKNQTYHIDIEPLDAEAGEPLVFEFTYNGPKSNEEVDVDLIAYMVAEDGTIENLPEHPCEVEPKLPKPCNCGIKTITFEYCMSAPLNDCCCTQPSHIRPRGFMHLTTSSIPDEHPSFLEMSEGFVTMNTSDRAEHGRRTKVLIVSHKRFATSLNKNKWAISITPDRYEQRLWQTSTIRMVAKVFNSSGQRIFRERAEITLLPPKLNIISSCSHIEKGVPFQLYISFNNPFNMKLSKVTVNIDTPGDEDEELEYSNSVKPYEKVTFISKPFILDTPGIQTVTISMDSCEYAMVVGSFTVDVPEEDTRFNGTICNDVPVPRL